MSFREKSTWVMLVALVVALSGYVTSRLQDGFETGTVMGVVSMTIGLIVVAIIGHIIVGGFAGRDGDRIDERDLAVDRKTDRLGDGALSAVILGILAYGMIQGDWILAHIALFGLFGAALLKSAAMVILYRMGA